MKGLQSLFLGIFGIFAFSWLGMAVITNFQMGSLNPQTDEDGGDVYPSPLSGMARRGAQVYAANGCVYCHSQQVRPGYGGSDLDRKWGPRRRAPGDYIFERVGLRGKGGRGAGRKGGRQSGSGSAARLAAGASITSSTPARRSRRRSTSRTATSPTASCPTRRST
mgnify:CR=1 FL=1